MAAEKIIEPYPGYFDLIEQGSRIGLSVSRPRRIALRGRPPRQPEVVEILLGRVRSGLTERIWMRERRQIERAWSAANPPSDKTIKRAIAHLYQRLRWENGQLTVASIKEVLAAAVGQKMTE